MVSEADRFVLSLVGLLALIRAPRLNPLIGRPDLVNMFDAVVALGCLVFYYMLY